MAPRTWLAKFVLFAVGAVAVLSIYELYFDRGLLIDSLAVPKTFEDQGYTSEVVINRIYDQMEEFYEHPTAISNPTSSPTDETKGNNQVVQGTIQQLKINQSFVDRSFLNNLQVPETTISIHTVLVWWHRNLFRRRSVSGEITTAKCIDTQSPSKTPSNEVPVDSCILITLRVKPAYGLSSSDFLQTRGGSISMRHERREVLVNISVNSSDPETVIGKLTSELLVLAGQSQTADSTDAENLQSYLTLADGLFYQHKYKDSIEYYEKAYDVIENRKDKKTDKLSRDDETLAAQTSYNLSVALRVKADLEKDPAKRLEDLTQALEKVTEASKLKPNDSGYSAARGFAEDELKKSTRGSTKN